MKSLKAKLILGISVFIVILLTIAAFMQINEKEKELIKDTFTRARSFAELTSGKISEDYKLYLIPNSFVYFNREIKSVMTKDEDISWVQVVNFQGDILYDSKTDTDQKYTGETRVIEDENLLSQLKSRKLSVKTATDRLIYFKKTTLPNGQAVYDPVNEDDAPVSDLATNEKIQYLVQPADEEYSIIYGVSYDALAARIQATQMRTFLLAIFGVALGILLAFLFGSNITKPLAVLKAGAEILATGDLTHRVEVKTHDEIYELAQTFNTMAAELQESTKALVYKERVGKELELARLIQQRIIPKEVPLISGLDLAAGIIPAEEIGGDCYDFLMPTKEELMFYLGDVTGHGVPSGIVVSIANALFYSYADRAKMDEILIEVNEVLKAKTMPNMFITLVLMKWLAVENKFSYVSAGHEQIIHYKAAERRVDLLPAGGLALGMVPDISKLIAIRDVPLEKDDVLVIYSDGIPEAWKNEKEMYGMERLKAIVEAYSGFSTALAIKNAIISDVYLYRQGYKQMDDITLIVVKKT
jgi:serine phosphatase RsbU (regulator of sigma subunit)